MERNNNTIKKVPLIYQLQPVECSAASLAMVLAYFKKWVPLDELRYYCNITRDGANVLNIVEAAEHYGLIAKAYRKDIDDLKNDTSYPCIIHWNFSHFVVVCGFNGENAIINDPAKGKVVVKKDELNRLFTGIVIEFKKSNDFVPSGDKPNAFIIEIKKLLEEKKSLAIAAFLVIILAIINLVKPLINKLFIDNILQTEDKAALIQKYFISFVINNQLNIHFIIFVITLSLIEIFIIILKEKTNLSIEAKQATKANAKYIWHLLNLPLSFFERRKYSDLHQRKNLSTNLIKNLIDSFVPLIFQILMAIFYIVIMVLYDAKLGIFGIVSIVVSLLITGYINQHLLEQHKKSTIDSSMLYSSTISGIEMIETIKKGGSEENFINSWIGTLNRSLYSMKKIEELDTSCMLILDFVNNLISTLLIYFGVKYVLMDKWTIGMVVAFQGFYNCCSSQIVDATENYKNINSIIPKIERVDDVVKHNVDNTFKNKNAYVVELHKCKGIIDVKNISFRYKPFGEMLLSNISFKLNEHENVAIVGKSGCGKSTLAKIIMGMYQPNEGEILYGNNKINEMYKCEFCSSIQYVDINTTFFNDTIINNLKMWDESISDIDVYNATKDAQIFDEINERKNGFQYICKENAKEFSGGQRQRLEIARALAINPNVLIIDEATNALDLFTENKIIDAIFKRGISTIFITHRISIMEKCNRILILENGKIVEEGKHDELIKYSERYNELIIKV